MNFPLSNHYWLKNAQISTSLITQDSLPSSSVRTRDNLTLVNLEIREGIIQQIIPVETSANPENLPEHDLKKGQIWPCFIDAHTHLDKGHIWERTPNPDGSFQGAIHSVHKDAEPYWDAEDIYRRIEFGLKCSYAHGTQAIRTHIDTLGSYYLHSWQAFQTLKKDWADKITLQAVNLVPLSEFLTPKGEKIADLVAEFQGILGGVAYMHPDLEKQLDVVFQLAQERHLDLDFHTDESTNPDDMALRYVAEAALRHNFSGRIVCGHCCSLAVQPPVVAQKTLDLVKAANINIISLPMCNLFLQDRSPARTPRWRGVTLIQEMQAQGIPVAVASDNCRDPFYGFGDHDGLEVFTQAVRIAHLDRPYDNWPQIVTSTPAQLMGLPNLGKIGVGLAADLILFKGRSFSELLSRRQHDRIVLRQGQPIDTMLPDYAELDDLIAKKR